MAKLSGVLLFGSRSSVWTVITQWQSFIFNLLEMETEINGHNGAIFIIIDHNNDHTVKDGNDRLVQSPGDK